MSSERMESDSPLGGVPASPAGVSGEHPLRMSKSALRSFQSFAGAFGAHPVPSLLSRLFVFAESIDTESFSGTFMLFDGGPEALQSGFGGREDLASRFVVFGIDISESLYGLWLRDGRGLDEAPVVFMDSDMSEYTAVLASNLREFFSLLALNHDALGYTAGRGFPPDEAPYRKNAAQHQRFSTWLAGLGIHAPEGPQAVVERAKAAHPDLKDWIEEKLSAISDP